VVRIPRSSSASFNRSARAETLVSAPLRLLGFVDFDCFDALGLTQGSLSGICIAGFSNARSTP